MSVTGPDVSSHQGFVAWSAVAGAGHRFGWTKSTGGAWYTNPSFADQWAGLKAAGLPRGSYHYAFEHSGQPYPGPGPIAEADFFLETVLSRGLADGDMLALDIEEGPGDVDLADWALQWLRHVESRVGFRPLVYTGRWFTDAHNFGACRELADYPLWIAAYQEAMPAPPAPWDRVVFWQQTDKASVPGVSGPCDLNLFNGAADALAVYGKPAEGVGVEPPPVTVPDLPTYDWTYPAISQNDSWSCSCTSTRWALFAYGRRPTEEWLEGSMLSSGVVTTEWGLMNATGAGLADWISREYGEYGYRGENDPTVTFDEVAAEAARLKHPLMIGGRNWGAGGHWTGVRGFADGKLALANPASGYGGITQVMSREQFSYAGPFSLVRLIHPAAEATVTPPTPPADPLEGKVGSGILEMMAADGTTPASPSTFLPLGAVPSALEQCLGMNGVNYVWHLPSGQHWRYDPRAAA